MQVLSKMQWQGVMGDGSSGDGTWKSPAGSRGRGLEPQWGCGQALKSCMKVV